DGDAGHVPVLDPEVGHGLARGERAGVAGGWRGDPLALDALHRRLHLVLGRADADRARGQIALAGGGDGGDIGLALERHADAAREAVLDVRPELVLEVADLDRLAERRAHLLARVAQSRARDTGVHLDQ